MVAHSDFLPAKLLGALGRGPLTRLRIFRNAQGMDEYSLEFITRTPMLSIVRLSLYYGEPASVQLLAHPQLDSIACTTLSWLSRSEKDLTWRSWMSPVPSIAVVCGGPQHVIYQVPPHDTRVIGIGTFVESSIAAFAAVCESKGVEARFASKAYERTARAWRTDYTEGLIPRVHLVA